MPGSLTSDQDASGTRLRTMIRLLDPPDDRSHVVAERGQ
jgi:hypothetical protein